jgi:nitrite reductase/ring-hydroxylating ferredoxin subunit/uncharacterized membrane protein
MAEVQASAMSGNGAGPVGRTAGRPAAPKVDVVLERIEELEAVDQPANQLAGAVRPLLASRAIKDALSGTWLGHPLHPALTDVVVGSWTSATVLDLIGGRASARAADRLVALGCLAAVPTASAGMSDWVDSTVDSGVRRVGAVHATANVAALALYAASLAWRRRGRRAAGTLLGLAGWSLVAASATLGGHLSYRQGIGVDQTTFEEAPDDWTPVLGAEELGEGELRGVEAGGVPVLLARVDGRVHALHDRCCHRGGPLHEGELRGESVVCPWHQSTFRLEDGSVERGPASMPQPALDVRVQDGNIEVREARRD